MTGPSSTTFGWPSFEGFGGYRSRTSKLPNAFRMASAEQPAWHLRVILPLSRIRQPKLALASSWAGQRQLVHVPLPVPPSRSSIAFNPAYLFTFAARFAKLIFDSY